MSNYYTFIEAFSPFDWVLILYGLVGLTVKRLNTKCQLNFGFIIFVATRSYCIYQHIHGLVFFYSGFMDDFFINFFQLTGEVAWNMAAFIAHYHSLMFNRKVDEAMRKLISISQPSISRNVQLTFRILFAIISVHTMFMVPFVRYIFDVHPTGSWYLLPALCYDLGLLLYYQFFLITILYQLNINFKSVNFSCIKTLFFNYSLNFKTYKKIFKFISLSLVLNLFNLCLGTTNLLYTIIVEMKMKVAVLEILIWHGAFNITAIIVMLMEGIEAEV